MRTQCSRIKKWIVVPIVCIFFSLSLFAAGASAEGKPEKTTQLSTQQVTIAKKTAEMVMSTIGERYQISEGTLIIGLEGEQVSIGKLLVPCDVKLTYEINTDGRLVHRMVVLNIHEGASDRMWKIYR